MLVVPMVSVTKKGENLTLDFTAKEASELGLDPSMEYELSKVRSGIWILVDGAKKNSPERKPVHDETEEKIIGLLRKTPPRDRMEGWFEKKLNAEERKKFAEMLANGKVVKYKSSQVFRKALYTPEKKSDSMQEKKYENREKSIEEYTLEKDGFMVVRNEHRAKALSEELKYKIKDGSVKGTRAFTGEFFIISTPLLNSVQEKFLKEIRRQKNIQLGELSQKTGLTPTLIRIAGEFLKEDGQIIEKTKDHYKYID